LKLRIKIENFLQVLVIGSILLRVVFRKLANFSLREGFVAYYILYRKSSFLPIHQQIFALVLSRRYARDRSGKHLETLLLHFQVIYDLRTKQAADIGKTTEFEAGKQFLCRGCPAHLVTSFEDENLVLFLLQVIRSHQPVVAPTYNQRGVFL
jgi:hypothetical protein